MLRFSGASLLGRGVAQFRHYDCPFQCVVLNGDPGRGRCTVGDVPGGSDGGARRTLGADEEEEDQTYRDHDADGDAPCHGPVGHVGGGTGELVARCSC